MPQHINKKREALLQQDFTAEEFAQRRERVYDRLDGGSALVEGAEQMMSAPTTASVLLAAGRRSQGMRSARAISAIRASTFVRAGS